MNLLLIIRSEIIAVFILIFFIIYNTVCSRYRDGKDYFNGFAFTSLGHALMGLVTEITVNVSGFPIALNNIFHIIFFVFALLFSLKYFEYALSLIMPKKDFKIFLAIGYLISTVCIIIMIFSPIEYLQGNGTKYSAGLGPTLCYALGFVLMLFSDVLIIKYRKKINSITVWLLIPLSIITLAFMGLQIVIPEFLFTGCALTITTVGVFFAIENPIGKFKSRAFIDADTQMWNRNCYDYDIDKNYNHKKGNAELIYVLADINGLKTVNDSYGHMAGDALIKICADAMISSMTHAYRIYRVGGDEFAAIYLDTPIELVRTEISEIHAGCQKRSKGYPFEAAIAVGYAERKMNEPMSEAVMRADSMMYEEKDKYYIENGINRRGR